MKSSRRSCDGVFVRTGLLPCDTERSRRSKRSADPFDDDVHVPRVPASGSRGVLRIRRGSPATVRSVGSWTERDEQDHSTRPNFGGAQSKSGTTVRRRRGNAPFAALTWSQRPRAGQRPSRELASRSDTRSRSRSKGGSSIAFHSGPPATRLTSSRPPRSSTPTGPSHSHLERPPDAGREPRRAAGASGSHMFSTQPTGDRRQSYKVRTSDHSHRVELECSG